MAGLSQARRLGGAGRGRAHRLALWTRLAPDSTRHVLGAARFPGAEGAKEKGRGAFWASNSGLHRPRKEENCDNNH